MDKSIEVAVVAVVIMVTAVTIVFLVRGQADGFGSFSDDQQLSSQCELWDLRSNTEKLRENDCPQYDSTGSSGGGGSSTSSGTSNQYFAEQ